jgi:transposase
MGDREIARQLAIGRIRARWRSRFAAGGLEVILSDLPRSGRKRRIDAAEIVRVVTQTTPEGAIHWSTRKLAA